MTVKLLRKKDSLMKKVYIINKSQPDMLKRTTSTKKSLYQKVDWYSAFSPHMYLRKKKNKDEIY